MTNDQIITGILENQDVMIKKLYKEYFHRVKALTYSFRNTLLDPDDVFQEGLTRAVINVRNKRFKGDSTFLTYLLSICRNYCLSELKRSGKLEYAEVTEAAAETEDLFYDRLKMIEDVKKGMDELCVKILDMRFGISNGNEDAPSTGLRFDEIAGKLGIKADNARQRFKRCLDKLRGFVFNDKKFNEVFS